MFAIGEVEDSLLIWEAKTTSMDADCSVDIQLLCGAGLGPTRSYLQEDGSKIAEAVISRLDACLLSGDFEGFDVQETLEWYVDFYLNGGIRTDEIC